MANWLGTLEPKNNTMGVLWVFFTSCVFQIWAEEASNLEMPTSTD